MAPQDIKPLGYSCAEKQELIDSIRTAMDHILALSQQELRALSRHELQESRRIRLELKKAVEGRAALLAEYNEHLRAHGCK